MAVKVHSIESSAAAEIYITAVPQPGASPQKQAQQLFSEVAGTLRSRQAWLLQERVFTGKDAMGLVRDVRSGEYGDIDDGVAPSLLIGGKDDGGGFSGVQVHAVSGCGRPQVLVHNQAACGRLLKTARCTFLTLSAMAASEPLPAAERARAMLEKAELVLKRAGVDFLSVARTWMWLGDILSWYDDFNQVRNAFFTERGLIGTGSRQSMPASTGIGLALYDDEICGMDLTAVVEPVESIEFLEAIGKQQCALDYGSAFSRASRAITPGGETIYVSGTASIDASGATTHIGDIGGQIASTIENVRAVLKDMGCSDGDVVQMVAYCKTTEVKKALDGLKGGFDWPWLTVICDICRPDLLFEIEATAAVGMRESNN